MTEWSPVRSVIIFVINKIKQQLAGVWFVLSRIWLQTEFNNRKFCYQFMVLLSISAEIRTVDSQSDLRMLLELWLTIKINLQTF